MKILIISTYFPPLNSIASLRPYSWAKYWSELGHDVTVLTTTRKDLDAGLDLDCSGFRVISASLPDWHARLSAANQQGSKSANEEAGAFAPFKRWIRQSIGKLRDRTGILRETRMPSHLDCWYPSAIRSLPSGRWDVVVSTFSPYITHLVAYKLKRSGRARFWVADFRDLWVDHHLYSGLWPFSALERHLERRICTAADLVTTVSEPLVDTLKRKYPKVPVVAIENGFDPDDFLSLDPSPFFVDEKIRVIYTGSFYPVLKPEPIFAAINNIVQSKGAEFLDDFELVFAGNRAALAEELADVLGVRKWVKTIPLLPREDALRLQRDAHALLFLGLETPSVKGILSGKLFEYLNSGVEVWAFGVSQDGAVGEIISKSRCGIVFSDDVSLIENAIIDLIAKKSKRCVTPDRSVLLRYNRKDLAHRLLMCTGDSGV